MRDNTPVTASKAREQTARMKEDLATRAAEIFIEKEEVYSRIMMAADQGISHVFINLPPIETSTTGRMVAAVEYVDAVTRVLENLGFKIEFEFSNSLHDEDAIRVSW